MGKNIKKTEKSKQNAQKSYFINELNVISNSLLNFNSDEKHKLYLQTIKYLNFDMKNMF